MGTKQARSVLCMVGHYDLSLICVIAEMCAAQITNVQVFDTGKHAVGGRASTRTLLVDSGGSRVPIKVDHSAQSLSATQPK